MTRVSLSTLDIPMAEVGPENPLPPLTPPGLVTRPLDTSAADAGMARNLTYGKVRSLLPYTVQDGYSRDLADRKLRTAVVENGIVRAEFLLDLGGRMWSLQSRGRELLHRNPILQPANLALRNAWFAGGVEWNLGTTGHTPLSCAPMHAAKVVRPDGVEVLRMWEWERMRGLVYQLDVWAPPGSEMLYIQVRITNPGQVEAPVYWWSNIAVPETPGTRVVAPATHAWHLGHDGVLRHVEAPEGDPFALNRSADYFYDIPDGGRKWIAALEADGTGLVQTSTDRLIGRKLFVWGRGLGGQRWQEWLSPPGSAYLEIQAGLARTQLEHLPLPAGESWTWVEAYGLLRAGDDPGAALEAMLPKSTLDSVTGCLDQPPTERLHTGSGWGALERRLRRFDLPGTPFEESTLGRDQQSWLVLLDKGDMPAPAPKLAPVSYQVGEAWRGLLESAAPNWFTLYHLGVARYHEEDFAGARQAWESSLDSARNPWALRNLAVLDKHDDRLDAAVAKLRLAHAMVPHSRPLALETLQLLVATEPAEALKFVDRLPQPLRTHGRIRMLECSAAVKAGRLDRAGRIVDTGIVVDDLREGEDSLDDLWFSYHEARALLVDPSATPERVRKENPLPCLYDFRMS